MINEAWVVFVPTYTVKATIEQGALSVFIWCPFLTVMQLFQPNIRGFKYSQMAPEPWKFSWETFQRIRYMYLVALWDLMAPHLVHHLSAFQKPVPGWQVWLEDNRRILHYRLLPTTIQSATEMGYSNKYWHAIVYIGAHCCIDGTGSKKLLSAIAAARVQNTLISRTFL